MAPDRMALEALAPLLPLASLCHERRLAQLLQRSAEGAPMLISSEVVELRKVWCVPTPMGGKFVVCEVELGGETAIIFNAPLVGKRGPLSKCFTLVAGELRGRVTVNGCRICRGVWRLHECLTAVQRRVEELTVSERRVWIAGESLGAALAMVAVWRAAAAVGAAQGANLQLLALAPPRVGCAAFADQLASSAVALHFVLVAGDPVTHLPPYQCFVPRHQVLQPRIVELNCGKGLLAKHPWLSVVCICCSWPLKHSSATHLLPNLLQQLEASSELTDEVRQEVQRFSRLHREWRKARAPNFKKELECARRRGFSG